MRVIIPNPLGPPITFDSEHASRLFSQVVQLFAPITQLYQRFLTRRPLRLIVLLGGLMVLGSMMSGGWVLPTYSMEWGWQKEGVREGRVGRYVK